MLKKLIHSLVDRVIIFFYPQGNNIFWLRELNIEHEARVWR